MNIKKYFRSLVITVITFIYLIIIAGAVVRMTGSGMGCPDWPKCFGYYIPPTAASQIEWQPHHAYKKGTIIIREDALRIAAHNFSTTDSYDSKHWETYTKHDYAHFNVWHTWIEYINRLVTVIFGLPMLALFFCSFLYWNSQKKIPIIATVTLLAVGFQSWLGKVVVDSNLLPIRITIHMVVAFVILALLLYILFLTKSKIAKSSLQAFPKSFRNVFIFATILTLIQVALGTQVRQFVDEQVKTIGELHKAAWLQSPTLTFYIHRSFSILIVGVTSWLVWQQKRLGIALPKLNWVLACIGLELMTGIIMYYFHFPFLSQPLHLVISSLLFGVQFYILLEVFSKQENHQSIQ